MKKVVIFLAILVIGVMTTILELAILQLDGNIGFALTFAGTLMILGGIIGVCFYSSRARKFFVSVLEAFAQFI